MIINIRWQSPTVLIAAERKPNYFAEVENSLGRMSFNIMGFGVHFSLGLSRSIKVCFQAEF